MKTRVCAGCGGHLFGEDTESMGTYHGLDFYCFDCGEAESYNDDVADSDEDFAEEETVDDGP